MTWFWRTPHNKFSQLTTKKSKQVSVHHRPPKEPENQQTERRGWRTGTSYAKRCLLFTGLQSQKLNNAEDGLWCRRCKRLDPAGSDSASLPLYPTGHGVCTCSKTCLTGTENSTKHAVKARSSCVVGPILVMKANAVNYDTILRTQYANFRGNTLDQATKQDKSFPFTVFDRSSVV